MWYGGDYYPEQWDEKTIEEDFLLMKKLKVTCMTVGVFAWQALEPEDGKFTFDWMDKILQRFYDEKIDVILATPTSGIPYWLSRKYPEIMHVDIEGRRVLNGTREKICPNSPIYREYSARIAGELAKRYGRHPAVKLWHINNEYHFYCYCPVCTKEFRVFLERKYGNIDELNKAWNTPFWGHTYTDFRQVEIPGYLTDIKKGQFIGKDVACCQGQYLDYMRFMSESVKGCITNEKTAIRKHSTFPVTNNFSGLVKTYDYRILSAPLDTISWDNYPSFEEPRYRAAFMHDLVRSIKQKPFLVMEQSPGIVTWEPYTTVKRPGEVGTIAWQGIAHGAESSMFFQWRQSRGGVEKFHGAMIPHSGRLDTRMGKELSELGIQFKAAGDVLKGSMPEAKVAILFEWENWWALEGSAIHNCSLDYPNQVLKYYRAFYEYGISVDVVDKEGAAKGNYDIIIAPCCYMCTKKFSEWISEHVEGGGIFLTTFLSGITDCNDSVLPGGYPGAFRDILGIWVEEIDGLQPHMKNRVNMQDGSSWMCEEVCDLIRLDTAEVLGWYGEDFYKNTPCITRNTFGKGKAYYIGTSIEYNLIKAIISKICVEKNIPYLNLPNDTEFASRETDEMKYSFWINHGTEACSIETGNGGIDLLTGKEYQGKAELKPHQCIILGEQKRQG